MCACSHAESWQFAASVRIPLFMNRKLSPPPRTMFWLTTTFLLLPPIPALAQPFSGNLRETAANLGEAKKDRAALADDRLDRARIRKISRDWKRAVASNNRVAERAADKRLKLWLTQELQESRREVGEARREKNRSRAERNRSRRKSRQIGGVGDRRDLRDDRRDLRDDRRDQAASRADLAQTRKTARQLLKLQPAFNPRYGDQGSVPEEKATARTLGSICRSGSSSRQA